MHAIICIFLLSTTLKIHTLLHQTPQTSSLPRHDDSPLLHDLIKELKHEVKELRKETRGEVKMLKEQGAPTSNHNTTMQHALFLMVDKTPSITRPVNPKGTSPSFLETAIDSCKAEGQTLGGEYPSIFKQIVIERQKRWKKKKDSMNVIGMINDKLGGYMYATKLGVRTPQILFCGVAKDLPRDIASLGKKYVVKPLNGWSARGVKVVYDGVNVLKGKKVSYDILVKEYGPEEETVVEEIVESADSKYNGLAPPDYKVHVFEGVPEIMFRMDRNKGQKCWDFVDVSSKWKRIEGFLQSVSGYPNCPASTSYPEPSREAALMNAVRILASKVSKNWIRIDMYDSKDGPILGEFTPFSALGKADPLPSCVMSYLFTAHAKHGGLTDDADTIRALKQGLGLKQSDVPEDQDQKEDKFDFYPPEAQEWKQYKQISKCNMVMKAQQELSELNGKKVNMIGTSGLGNVLRNKMNKKDMADHTTGTDSMDVTSEREKEKAP